MQTKRTWLFAGVAIAVVAGLPVAWYLISPLFINRTVDEALPTAAAAMPVATPVPALPTAAAPSVPADATAVMEEALAEPTQAAQESMPAEMSTMRVLAQGEFYPIAHEGHGRATLYELADGARVLRLEDFEVLNGPDLHVWLVPIDPVPNTAGVEIGGYADLGKLKGNIGSQNYAIAADLDLARFKSVVIWCQPFRVPFIAAPLEKP